MASPDTIRRVELDAFNAGWDAAQERWMAYLPMLEEACWMAAELLDWKCDQTDYEPEDYDSMQREAQQLTGLAVRLNRMRNG